MIFVIVVVFNDCGDGENDILRFWQFGGGTMSHCKLDKLKMLILARSRMKKMRWSKRGIVVGTQLDREIHSSTARSPSWQATVWGIKRCVETRSNPNSACGMVT